MNQRAYTNVFYRSEALQVATGSGDKSLRDLRLGTVVMVDHTVRGPIAGHITGFGRNPMDELILKIRLEGETEDTVVHPAKVVIC